MEILKKAFHPIYLISILICCVVWGGISGTLLIGAEVGVSVIPMLFFAYDVILLILLIKKKKLGYIMQAWHAIISGLIGFLTAVIGFCTLSTIFEAIFVVIIGASIMTFQYYAIKHYDKEDKKLHKSKEEIQVNTNDTTNKIKQETNINTENTEIVKKEKKKDIDKANTEKKTSKIDKLYGKYLPLYYIVFFNLFTISTYHFTGSLFFIPSIFVSIASILLGYGLMKKSKTAYQIQYIFNSLVSLTLLTQIFSLFDEKITGGAPEQIARIFILLIAPIGMAIHIYAMIYLSKKKKRYLKKKKKQLEPKLKLNNWFSMFISLMPAWFLPCLPDLVYEVNPLSIAGLAPEIANPVTVFVYGAFLTALFPLTGYLLRKRTRYGYALQFATNGTFIVIDLFAIAMITLFFPAMISRGLASTGLLLILFVVFFITIHVGIMKYYVKNKEYFLVDSNTSKDENGKIENIDETIKTEVLVQTEMTEEIINKTEEIQEQ